MRNVLAHAGKQGRRVVSAFIATAFAQDDATAAKAQWRRVADQLRPKLPKIAAFLDEAETDVLAYMTSRSTSGQAPLDQSDRGRQRRDQSRTEVVGIFPTRTPSSGSSAPSSSS